MFGFYNSMDPAQDLTGGGLADRGAKDAQLGGIAGDSSGTTAAKKN
jgi:hypothetical protein